MPYEICKGRREEIDAYISRTTKIKAAAWGRQKSYIDT
jgi:hypothetical protein